MGIELSRSASSPVRDGHRPANHSYVRRPMSIASEVVASEEREPAELGAVGDEADPATPLEPFVARGILHDAIDRDVVTDDDPSHPGHQLLLTTCTLWYTLFGDGAGVNRRQGTRCPMANGWAADVREREGSDDDRTR